MVEVQKLVCYHIPQQIAIQRSAYCAKIRVIRVLIDNKADLSVRYKDGLTWLHLAVRYAHLGIAKFWLDHIDDLEARDEQIWAPLMYAAWFGHSIIVACLGDNGAYPKAKSVGRKYIALSCHLKWAC